MACESQSEHHFIICVCLFPCSPQAWNALIFHLLVLKVLECVCACLCCVCVCVYAHAQSSHQSSPSRLLPNGLSMDSGMSYFLCVPRVWPRPWHRVASENTERINEVNRMLGQVRTHLAAMATTTWRTQSSLGAAKELGGLAVIFP